MGVLQPLVVLVIFAGVIGSTNAAFQNPRFSGTDTLDDYTVCYDNLPDIAITLVCNSDQLIHIDTVIVSKEDGCQQNFSCRADKTDEVVHDCEGTLGECYHYLRADYDCFSFNKVEVKFQCIDDRRVHDMCPYYPRTFFHYTPSYYITPRFDEYPMRYRSNERCECTITSNSFINIEIMYLDMERSSSTKYCYDYISTSSANQFCTTTDVYGQRIKRTYYKAAALKFVSDSSVVKRGGWLKISSPGGAMVEVRCEQSKTTTTATTPYFWTTNWWDATTRDYYDDGLDTAGLTAGIIGGMVGLVLIIILVAVFVGRRGNIYVRRAGQARRGDPQTPSTFVASGHPPATLSNAPPPAYTTLPLQTTAKDPTDQSPPSYAAATGPV